MGLVSPKKYTEKYRAKFLISHTCGRRNLKFGVPVLIIASSGRNDLLADRSDRMLRGDDHQDGDAFSTKLAEPHHMDDEYLRDNRRAISRQPQSD